MVGPFVVFNSVLEWTVIIVATADVNDEVVVRMGLLKIVCDILYIISISFFKKLRGWVGHSDDSISDIGQIKLLPLIACCILRPSHDFSY